MWAARPKKSTSIYGVHPGVMMVEKWIAGLKAKTGRSLDEWVALAKKEGPAGETDRREWLKITHQLGTNTAWWIAARVEGKKSEEDSPERYLAAAPKYVDGQYSGKKKALRPLYEAVLRLAAKLGAEVKACPCKTIVPLYRNHVFAQLKPTTNTRLDLGLSLAHYKGKLPERLVETGGLAKKDRITHRIGLATQKDIDSDVEKWLKIAYDLDRE
jgi:hypothetical protein